MLALQEELARRDALQEQFGVEEELAEGARQARARDLAAALGAEQARGDVGEIWWRSRGRCGGDLGEMWGRCGGDVGRYKGGVGEI